MTTSVRALPICLMSCLNFCYVECRYVECHYADCRYAECSYAECHYAECSYAECHYALCRGTKQTHIFTQNCF
jgi:hypothetical protein